MPPHDDKVQPDLAWTSSRDPDNLSADEATAVFSRRIRFAIVLRQVVHWAGDDDVGNVLDLSDAAVHHEWAGTLAVIKHARTLRLTGWMDATGVWRRE